MKVFTEKCWSCGLPFENEEYVNYIKLDDGSIHIVHGGKCSNGDLIKRGPMKNGDWWIKRVGIVYTVEVPILFDDTNIHLPSKKYIHTEALSESKQKARVNEEEK